MELSEEFILELTEVQQRPLLPSGYMQNGANLKLAHF